MEFPIRLGGYPAYVQGQIHVQLPVRDDDTHMCEMAPPPMDLAPPPSGDGESDG